VTEVHKSMNRLSAYSLLPRVHSRFAKAKHRPLYLTFDDGPDPEVTPRVLDELDRHGARGTFFVIGERAEQYHRIMTDIVTRGHDLGNHSFFHRKFGELPMRSQLSEIERTDKVLKQFNQRSHNPFRPPHGRASIPLLLALAMNRYRTVLWSIDSRDYARDTDASVARLADNGADAGDVVLLHDDHVTAVDVLRKCLPGWTAAGLSHPTVGSAIGG